MSDHSMKMSAARLAATRAAPYFSHALLSLIPVIVPTGTLTEHGTFAVTPEFVLLMEEGALERWNPKEAGAVLNHEVSHILRAHFRRRGTRDPKLSNYAEDMEINDDLAAMGLSLPDGGGVQPKMIGEPNGKTFEYYYEKMNSQVQQMMKQIESAMGAGHGVKEGVGRGKCGGCAGNPHAKEQDAVPEGTPKRTKAEVSQIASAVAHAVREHVEQKKAGTVPLGIQRWADLHGTPPEVPWQEQLARACRRAIAYRPGAIDFRYTRPSRRQAGLGFGHGKAVMPALVLPVPQVAVMFDTSGSMGGSDLASAARETDGVLKAVGARVRFCVVDAKVHALQDVQTIEQALKLLKGGGGTDFTEAFEELEKSRPRPEVIVVMTDGHASVPRTAPLARVIWCLVGKSPNEHPAPWGDVVKVS